MIKTEYLKDGKFIKHYSDAGYKLIQLETGLKYVAPVDVVPCKYTYKETKELINSGSKKNIRDGCKGAQ